MKKRILMCSESSHIASGFGNYTKNILQKLYNTNKYELAELACYRDTSVPKTEPWVVYPVAVNSSHPLYNDYISNDANQFGQWRFEMAVMDFKPHIVLDIRDFWNFLYQETSPIRNFYHWIIAPTYDSAPQKIETINTFSNADVLCFHTDWAKTNLIDKYNYKVPNIGPVVNDSVDPEIFHPLGHSKKNHKKSYNISEDTIIIGSVMRNQKRKLIPDLISVFSKLCDKHKDKNIVLYLHTSFPDGLGWDLPNLLLEHGVAHKVLLSYVCRACKSFFPSIFKGPATNCPSCKKQDSAVIASVRNNITESDLANVYNLFDIYVQYAICEGFGIPPLEAACCGLPVITIDHEAMGEVAKNIGADIVPVIRTFREQETNADRHYPDNDILFGLLEKYINMDHASLNKIGKTCRKMALEKYSWDKTAKIFEELFDNIDINKKLPWNHPQRPVFPEYQVNSSDLNVRKIIYDIVDNVIQEPFLKDTNFIEEIIKNTNDGFVQHGQKISNFTLSTAIKILEKFMNNKVSLETVRTNGDITFSEKLYDFFEYSKR